MLQVAVNLQLVSLLSSYRYTSQTSGCNESLWVREGFTFNILLQFRQIINSHISFMAIFLLGYGNVGVRNTSSIRITQSYKIGFILVVKNQF